jgi:hypothetical protein
MIRRFWADDWFDGFWNTNFTFGELVDTRKYDIISGEKVPRKDYQARLVEQKDRELKELEEYYNKRKKEIEGEKKALSG